eukprot:CAMPEP_0184744904 /NCGR_PEP_ID=MMETSP0315-20130426/7650_1 /TAXON_ID=101924 /ORGANISM="Rhodosorus marinus, Strain UTEX LB 2760" /LENGTH=58 /DNA_ID=CAMNT_0027216865 /DNA_START=51 /DNA_END=227 /DNA_ORIENTATION=-
MTYFKRQKVASQDIVTGMGDEPENTHRSAKQKHGLCGFRKGRPAGAEEIRDDINPRSS